MFLAFLGDVGGSELLLIGVVALVVLGPQRLPEMARKLGQLMGQFRRASTDLQRQLNNELRDAADGTGDAASSFGTQAAAWASRLKGELVSTLADAKPAAPPPAPGAEVTSSRPLPPGAHDVTPAAEPSPAGSAAAPEPVPPVAPPPTEPESPRDEAPRG